MNYLAHLYLAEDDPASIIGNLMGDFVKGRVPDDLCPALRRGIIMHRKVDVYTDTHPIFRVSKQRIRPQFRRYGGVLVDIYYDHFLARDWDRYSAKSLRNFSLTVYRILHDHYRELPTRMQRSIRYMIANDLLMSYQKIDSIGRSLAGIERRLKRASRLHEAVIDLEQNYAALGADFNAFFPQLIAFVEAESRMH